MNNICLKVDINEIEIVTSPEAKEFCIKMGTLELGDVESIVKKGRIISKLIYNFGL